MNHDPSHADTVQMLSMAIIWQVASFALGCRYQADARFQIDLRSKRTLAISQQLRDQERPEPYGRRLCID
jgi:hypothetical protein